MTRIERKKKKFAMYILDEEGKPIHNFNLFETLDICEAVATTIVEKKKSWDKEIVSVEISLDGKIISIVSDTIN